MDRLCYFNVDAGNDKLINISASVYQNINLENKIFCGFD